MTGRRKAPERIPLTTYAQATLARKRIDAELGEHVCGPGCSAPVTIAGERWPCCPRRLTDNPTWAGIVDLYVAAQVSPLEGWPSSYAPYVLDGALELKRLAIERDKKELETRAREVNRDEPAPTGRRAWRG